MSKNKFSVTFEIVTDESASNGEAHKTGFVGKNLSLRDAIALVGETESPHCERESVQLTVFNGREWQSGEFENRSLHFPEGTTESTKRRALRAIKRGN